MTGALKIDRVLFATNFSPACKAALRQGAALARHFRAQLYLLHIIPEGRQTPAELAAAERRVSAEARRLRRESWNAPDDLVVAVVAGDPATRILQKARDVDADLIVMGTRRLQGSTKSPDCVARTVARGAPCPVLTIPHAHVPRAAAKTMRALP
ncbi:MAG: universal stress protein [Candidatus Binatia bacterium]